MAGKARSADKSAAGRGTGSALPPEAEVRLSRVGEVSGVPVAVGAQVPLRVANLGALAVDRQVRDDAGAAAETVRTAVVRTMTRSPFGRARTVKPKDA